ncbi:S66 peptidase family protein [Gaopeijia maritima]|uniref:S66 peptidase family protein n=1 Tax=Gaopeijia maritima TaxID=3119007 RepID=UPI00326B9F13
MAPTPPPAPPEPPRRPRRLRPGSRIALVAPAGPLASERVAAAEARCLALGFEPRTGRCVHMRHGFLAGPDADRLADLQAAIDDPEVDAIWALRGGYGTVRIVDDLVLDRLLDDPIAFLGFSDNTAIHARLAALGIVSFHSPHPTTTGPSPADDWFRRVTGVAEPAGALPTPVAPTRLNGGQAEGRLAGGNLALLSSLAGTRDAVSGAGRILVIEDVGEPAYRIDRMLVQLRRSGTLDGVRGLAFGTFTGVPGGGSPDGVKTLAERAVEEVLRECAIDLGVPAIMGLPIGHGADNVVVPLGVRARLDAQQGRLEVIEPAVR